MKKIKALLLAIVLLLISIIVIVVNGKTYTLRIDDKNIENAEKVEIEDESVVKCVDKQLKDGVLIVKLESVSKGKTYINVEKSEGMYYTQSIYVHDFGIITINEYMGDSSASIIIPISATIWLIYVFYLFVVSYQQSVKENLYQYKNIAYLGIIIFTAFLIFNQIVSLMHYKGLIYTIEGILNAFSFVVLLLPLVFIVSLLVIISNIVLIRKEGFNFTNILGVILGMLLCLVTLLPDLMYRLVYTATWIDVHNQNGIGLYLYNIVETVIFIIITYIECILMGTIIMGFKSAKHIPKLDKDFIVILGCQIKKDGTLTNLLKGRVDRAIAFGKMQKERANKDIVYVPSGGKGSDEVISEAQAMKNYLLEQEIPEEQILLEDKSTNTFENIAFSNKLIKEKMKNAKVAFSTTNYHVFRAGNIATMQGLSMEGIGAKTKSYFWINAFIREFIATIFLEKKKHLAIIGGIILFAIGIIAITFFNNNI